MKGIAPAQNTHNTQNRANNGHFFNSVYCVYSVGLNENKNLIPKHVKTLQPNDLHEVILMQHMQLAQGWMWACMAQVIIKSQPPAALQDVLFNAMKK
ncbi:MAG: hypothetical protein GY782_03310 [Gammaproteobacteria bacterium]|nr:hypothetical protein [Gammaproteobacteria bacterium]